MVFPSNKILHWIVVLCFFSVIFGSSPISNTFKNSTMRTKKNSLIALLFTTNASFFDQELEIGKNRCRWLKGLRYQRKQCQRIKGLAELLQKTRQLTLSSCQLQFQYEHWNCSTIYMKKIFKKMYRETAFMYSLATSAFMHLVAQACADGKLEVNCICASLPRSDKPNKWDWAGCSVNTRYASIFVEKFLELKQIGDNPSNIMKYNSKVGLRVARRKTEKKCTCHGLSGACNLQTCFMRVSPFLNVTRDLKQLYHKAIQVESENTIHEMPNKMKKKKQLLFLDPTPNVCDSNHKSWLLPVTGRKCGNIDSCATLCCSHGYHTAVEIMPDYCNCSWYPAVVLKCKNCTHLLNMNYCK
ncbi:protein Wnt-9a-like [Euwallacea fornicatus]|uniref:protein Wnt-9a-like n=1 Tax=Euwallacea fornicatus TaxID=995702 RepID=UPI00338EEA6D